MGGGPLHLGDFVSQQTPRDAEGLRSVVATSSSSAPSNRPWVLRIDPKSLKTSMQTLKRLPRRSLEVKSTWVFD